MTVKTYLIRFKAPGVSPQLVAANGTQIHDEHLVFLNSKGKLVALFLLDTVEGWSELPKQLGPKDEGHSFSRDINDKYC